MIRHTLTLIANRWRSNLWLAFALLLAFGLGWYMMDYFFVQAYNRMMPAGRDTRGVWQVQVAELPASSADYSAAAADSARRLDNHYRLLERLAAYPGVTAVAVSEDCASLPYTLCMNGNKWRNPDDPDRHTSGMCVWADPSTDFPAVFAHRDTEGRVVSSADYPWDGPNPALISRGMAVALFGSAAEARGRLMVDGDSVSYRVQGVIEDVKRFDNRVPWHFVILATRPGPKNLANLNYLIRTDGSLPAARFAEEFRERMSRELRVGNFYLRALTSMDAIKAATASTLGTTYDNRTRLSLMVFLGVNIVLCVMGSFWYRVRLRRGEIGLRMALGATRREVRLSMIREGLCLLVLAMLPALLIEAHLVFLDFLEVPGGDIPAGYLPANLPLRFLVANGLAFLLMAALIILAVWVPSSRAAELEPAEALGCE